MSEKIMKIGYARVSTREQNLDLQIKALETEGCSRIFEEKASSGKERPELQKLLSFLRAGDMIVVWKLDRLGRSLKELIALMEDLKEKQVGFKSLTDNIDTTTTTGRFQFAVFSALAEYEREIIRERTMAGLEAAKESGRTGGRKKGLSKQAKTKAMAAKKLYESKEMSNVDIMKTLGISSKATLYAYLEEAGTEYKRKTKE